MNATSVSVLVRVVLLTAVGVLALTAAAPARGDEEPVLVTLLPAPFEPPELAPSSPATTVLPRYTSDRPDDTNGYQLHFVYVLPSGTVDGQRDILEHFMPRSISAMNYWMSTKTGRTWRVDTYQGQPDITFIQSAKTNDQMQVGGALNNLDDEITGRSWNNYVKKKFVIYYEGTGEACGATRLSYFVAVTYLGAGAGCYTTYWADSPTQPRALDNTTLQETMHMMGLVASGAPHLCVVAHVCDDGPAPNGVGGDVMWPGAHDMPSNLDNDRQDYYQHGQSFADLQWSNWLTPDIDADDDRVADVSDNCPAVYNPSQTNSDTDSLGDACDNCPNISNPGQENRVHPGTTAGDACEDPDADGVVDATDNCPDNANANQADTDSDLDGDTCDNCPQTYNGDQTDYDLDAIPGTQPPPGATWGGYPCDTDDDSDGYSNVVELGNPLCESDVNDDNFDDSRVNDGCPPRGPAESACSDALDNDFDGYYNDGCPAQGTYSEAAFKIATNPFLSCQSSGWPSDLVSTSPSNDRVDLQDIGSFVAPAPKRLGTKPGDAGFSKRWDVVPGAPSPLLPWINLQDVAALVVTRIPTGAPPMFGGQRAFNGPTCHEPPFP